MPEAPAASGIKTPQFQVLVPTILAAVYFLAHMATAMGYGYFRDALYFLACSEHLAWGYADARDNYESVSVAATPDNPHSMPYERNFILLCRHPKESLQSEWPDIKNWD
jgi:hypothetical protein